MTSNYMPSSVQKLQCWYLGTYLTPAITSSGARSYPKCLSRVRHNSRKAELKFDKPSQTWKISKVKKKPIHLYTATSNTPSARPIHLPFFPVVLPLRPANLPGSKRPTGRRSSRLPYVASAGPCLGLLKSSVGIQDRPSRCKRFPTAGDDAPTCSLQYSFVLLGNSCSFSRASRAPTVQSWQFLPGAGRLVRSLP